MGDQYIRTNKSPFVSNTPLAIDRYHIHGAVRLRSTMHAQSSKFNSLFMRQQWCPQLRLPCPCWYLNRRPSRLKPLYQRNPVTLPCEFLAWANEEVYHSKIKKMRRPRQAHSTRGIAAQGRVAQRATRRCVCSLDYLGGHSREWNHRHQRACAHEVKSCDEW